jgi:hypothetical protein
MRCGWMDVRYRFLIPTSPQYIDSFFVPYAEKTTSKDLDCHIGALWPLLKPRPIRLRHEARLAGSAGGAQIDRFWVIELGYSVNY